MNYDLPNQKIDARASYEELEAKIPEVMVMKGFDQKSDFHDLTLDQHTRKLGEKLEQDEFLKMLPEKIRDLVLLAGKLHDLGKVTPVGSQIHPRDPEKRQYVGHEKESERIAREILPKYFQLSQEEIDFVAKLTGLHASALNLVNNFEKNNQPKGSNLKSYGEFLQKVEEVPGDLDLNQKVEIIIALNKADKMAGFNDQSDRNSEKVQKIMAGSEKQVKVLEEMQKAWPALIEAIQAKRNGDQTAGIILENGKYRYDKKESV
jgi:CRISPR/Cas system-associated endonuclease Cas3-HD